MKADLNKLVNFHDELNPKLWQNNNLRREVEYKLLQIAKEFVKFINIDNLELEDITISGSNCSYNYNDQSDIDLHLVVSSDSPCWPHLQELYLAKKTLFNDQHDIKIRDIDVEVYVQDSKQKHISNGIYSLLEDKWLKQPRMIDAEVDKTNVEHKYRSLRFQIQIAVASEEPEKIWAMQDKIKRMRQAGLDKHGEFGPENLAFKMLRNDGTLDELYAAGDEAEDKRLSLPENFADGKGPGRPRDSQRHGIPKGATMAELEKASHAKGRKGQLARWQLNMRRGKKKANETSTPIDAKEIHNYEKLDSILVKLCKMVVRGKQKDPERYGAVAAAVLDPDNNLVTGINLPADKGQRRHAERVAIDNYTSKHGDIPEGSIIITTCSPCSEHMDERYEESCTDLINQSGVKKVYAGYMDPTQPEEQREFDIIETRNKSIRNICKEFASSFVDKELAMQDSQIDEKWSQKYKRSIDCSHPKGFSQKAHCAGRKKTFKEAGGPDMSRRGFLAGLGALVASSGLPKAAASALEQILGITTPEHLENMQHAFKSRGTLLQLTNDELDKISTAIKGAPLDTWPGFRDTHKSVYGNPLIDQAYRKLTGEDMKAARVAKILKDNSIDPVKFFESPTVKAVIDKVRQEWAAKWAQSGASDDPFKDPDYEPPKMDDKKVRELEKKRDRAYKELTAKKDDRSTKGTAVGRMGPIQAPLKPTHISPSGVATNMSTSDDDYDINYGAKGVASKPKGKFVKPLTHKVNESVDDKPLITEPFKDPVAILKKYLDRMNNPNTDKIDLLMLRIANRNGIGADLLHKMWVDKYDETPDEYCGCEDNKKDESIEQLKRLSGL